MQWFDSKIPLLVRGFLLEIINIFDNIKGLRFLINA